MMVGGIQPGSRLGRATSNTFKLLFALATIIAAGATFVGISDTNPSVTGRPSLFWLLIANLVLIAGIAGILSVRVLQLLQENKATGGGARLRLRIISLFSLTAAIPTVLVAGFLGTMINRNVQIWFSDPVYNIVENGTAAARASKDDIVFDAQSKVAVMAEDLNSSNYVDAFRTNPQEFAQALEAQTQYREFARTRLMTSGAETVAEYVTPGAVPFRQMSDDNWEAARNGLIATYVDASEVSVLIKLEGYEDAFLYASRPIPAVLSARLAQAQADLQQFREVEAQRDRLATVLTLSYAEAALLMLLGTAWLGMTAAARIAMPVGELARAARAVRDGDLTVRAARPKVRDEIDDLADAFNQMTERVSRQTRDLDSARIEAEARSAFTETVLAGVEAGVMRVTPDLTITIANTSAEELLGFTHNANPRPSLYDVAEDFVAVTLRALESGQSVEASLKRGTDRGALHYQVRVAPEADGTGAVITLHDATRLVLGQRQAAWRDVARRIAHEIRNPLTPIQLSAERLRRRFASQITDDRETFERCTDTILRQVADIGRMVEEFSGFARMPKPTLGKFNLGDLVQSVAFAQRMTAPSVGISVSAPNEPIEILGDERMLAQALTNVIKNAAEAIERQVHNGEKKTGSVSVTLKAVGDEVHLITRDTGPGFPTQDRDRLLEPYVTTRKQGVGLGLAIVTRIVEDHGGTITLGDNDTGTSGAQVNIRLPRQPATTDEIVAFADEGAA